MAQGLEKLHCDLLLVCSMLALEQAAVTLISAWEALAKLFEGLCHLTAAWLWDPAASAE
jgi:hypothetical protein